MSGDMVGFILYLCVRLFIGLLYLAGLFFIYKVGMRVIKNAGKSWKQGQTGPTKNCPFCAEEIKAEAIKCKHCSESLVRRTTKGANACPKCSKEFDDTWKVCLHCGVPLIKNG